MRERYGSFAKRRSTRYVGDKLSQCRYYGMNVLKPADVPRGFKRPVAERMAPGGFTCFKFNEGKVAQGSWIIWIDCQTPLAVHGFPPAISLFLTFSNAVHAATVPPGGGKETKQRPSSSLT